MRAYHRVDPLMDERKSHYSPAQLGAFLKVQLVAGRQTRRGRFRSLDALRGALPASYVRHVDFLVSEGDLVIGDDGLVYLDGWDEWQEGDLTVKDRMARLRDRKRNQTVTPDVTSTVTTPVTVTVTRPYQTANAHAIADSSFSPEGGLGGGTDDEPEFPLLQWLAQHGCAIREGNGFHQKLITAVEVHGPDAILRQFERLAKAGMSHGDVQGYVFGAIDALNKAKRPDLKAIDSEERIEKRSRQIESRMWERRIEAYRMTGQWDPAWGEVPA